MSDSWMIYGFSYMLLYPEFDCVKDGQMLKWGSDDYKTYCTPSYFCQNTDVQISVITNSTVTLKNWIQDFELLCISEVEISLFSMMFFIAFFLAQFVTPKMQDAYGRKKVFLWSCFLNCLTLVAILVLPKSKSSQVALYVIIFFNGLAAPGRTITGFTYIVEFWPKRA